MVLEADARRLMETFDYRKGFLVKSSGVLHSDQAKTA